MNKPIDMFLTKEAFIEYTQRLREQTAKSYGLTLEEWDKAVLTQQTINQIPLTPPKEERCLHNQCPECNGTGIRFADGEICVHHISCSCPKCMPSLTNYM